MRWLFFIWCGWVAASGATPIFLKVAETCALNVGARTVGNILPADLEDLDRGRVINLLRNVLRIDSPDVDPFAKLRRILFVLPDEHRLFLVFAHQLDGRRRVSNEDLGQILGVSKYAVFARHGRIRQILSGKNLSRALALDDDALVPEQSLYGLGIPQNMIKRFFDNSVFTVDQVCQTSAATLDEWKGFGPIRIEEIRASLALRRRKLAGE